MSRTLAGALLFEALLIAALLTVVADQVAHTHVERQGGVNIWGYRGPVLHQKKANEIRIAVAGGDMSFGWGVAASESLAPSIRQRTAEVIDRPGTAGALVTSVTLGVRGLVPDDYASWIEHYAYLRPDVLCLVIDPIGHAPSPGPYVPDRRSLAFTRFGYSPILPLVLEERSVTAHSPLMRRAGALLGWADAMLGDGPPRSPAAIAPGPGYLAAIGAAVRAGLQAARVGVVVVVAPEDHDVVTRAGVPQMLASTFGSARVRLVDLGDDERMRHSELRLDHFSFSAGGHAVAAEVITPAVLDLIRQHDRGTR